jgi:predicted RNase H-like nuclease
LSRVFSDIDLDARVRVRGTSPDDVLDAFASAWSATRWLSGRHVQLGGDLDSRGLRMEMIA